MRLIALCLLCFTFQSALASAHFHLTSAPGAAHVAGETWKPDLAKRSGANEASGCALCQFLVLGATALHPSFCAALAPVETAEFVVDHQTFERFVTAVSYSWQGRGPPLI